MRSTRRARRIAVCVGREFLPAELDRDRPFRERDVMAAWARETFTMAEPAMQRHGIARRLFRGAHASRVLVSASGRNNLSLGSSRVRKRLCSKVRDREDALANTRDACATQKCAGGGPSESTAAVETNTTQEHRASHPRPSRAQEPCHLSGCYRFGTRD